MTPDQFREWLDRMGYTGKHAAGQLDYSERQITNFCNGKHEIPPTVAFSCYYLLSLKVGKLLYAPSLTARPDGAGIIFGDEILPAPPAARA